MGLSEEQKQRIREEEQRRLEEERYRAEVRRELRNGTPAPPKRTAVRVVLILAALGLGALAAFYTLRLRSPNATRPQQASKPIPTPAVKLTTAQIAERATPSVVTIENSNEEGNPQGQGSGYVTDAGGTVITNYHVIRAASAIQVHFPSGGPSFNVESLLGYDIDNDIAAFQVPGLSIPPLETEAAEQPKVGDRVVAIGAPLGLESTVSEGIISALRDAGPAQIIQTTAPISPGSSGGPLLNEYGRIIGVATAQMTAGQNLNFSIPVRFVTQLLAAKRSVPLAQMLSETEVIEHPLDSTVSVPARKAVTLTIPIGHPQGAILENNFSVSGGTGNDIAVTLLAPNGLVIFDTGKVQSTGQFKLRLSAGIYRLVFDNTFSMLSPKSVSQDLKLIHYR